MANEPTQVDVLPWEQPAQNNATVVDKLPFEPTTQNQASPEPAANRFVEGFKSVDQVEDRMSVTAGGVLTEMLTSTGFKGIPPNPRIVNEGTRADKFEKWQPIIWDAEDHLNTIQNKTSPEYQIAWSNLRSLRENMKDDLEGNYEPPDQDFSMGDFVNTIKDDFGFVSGMMTGELVANPEMMAVPMGYVKAANRAGKAAKAAQLSSAKVAAARFGGGVAGAGTLGGGMAFTEELVSQLDEDINAPIDFDRVANSTVMGTGVSVMFPVLGEAARVPLKPLMSKAGAIWDTAKIAKITEEAQTIYNNSIVDGRPEISKQLAVDKAIAKFAPTPETTEKLPNLDEYMSDTVLVQKAKEEANRTGVAANTADLLTRFGVGSKDIINDLTQPITSRLRAMGYTNLARALNEHDMNLGTDIHRKQEIAEKFSNQFGALNKNQQRTAALHLNNGTFSRVADQFDAAFNASAKEVRDMLDSEYDEMIEVGMKVGKTENYFPRTMDWERFAKDNDLNTADIGREFAAKANAKLNLKGGNELKSKDMTFPMIQKHFNEREISEILMHKVASQTPKPTVKSSTNNLKARTIDEIDPENMQYYADPRAALHDHINKVTVKIHDRRYFGGKKLDEEYSSGMGGEPAEESLVDSFIQDHLAQMQNAGDLDPKDLDKVQKLLHARFVGSKKQAAGWINATKNLMYAATLGNPLAASVQLGDLGAGAYMNGYTKMVDGFIGDAIEGTRFRLKDFGLEAIPEIETMGATKKALDWSLRAGGFRAMDQLGKEVILNSTYKKLKSVMDAPNLSDSDRFKYFKDRYGQRLGQDEVRKIMAGVASGDPTNHHARLAMYSDLTRVQPISMSEMPVAYLNHPDARIFFMLKTFTLKQIDLMRNEVVNELRTNAKTGHKRNVGKAALNLGKLAGTIGAANMGVEWTKRWMTGDEQSLPDAVVNTVLRNYGLSPYTLDNIVKGNVFESALRLASPPVQVFEQPLVKELPNAINPKWGTDTKGRWVDSIPVVGRVYRTAVESGAISDPFNTGLERKR